MSGEQLTNAVTLHVGDCLDVLRTMPDASVDAVVTDPPYPCIDRPYGYWTEAEWFALMNPVVEECRRILKPTGSAVFILQPTNNGIGRTRPWLWEFMAKWCREWNQVQDWWWWNNAALPDGFAIQGKLGRQSVKACVWLGAPTCYRNQSDVLWSESDSMKACRLSARWENKPKPSGQKVNPGRMAEQSRIAGGTKPFNLIPCANTNSTDSAGSHGHGAGTPLTLCRWWTRYICPPGGAVLDPFAGSGTTGLAAVAEGRNAILIERYEQYAEIIRKRIQPKRAELFA